ncbi:MAG TPA: hypothetical protein VGL72_33015, partial [Bryobacteraceae bacterium]
FVEFISAQRSFRDREKLVQLWRRHRSTAEHRVSLATVMDLVLEQVQKKAIRTLRLHAGASVNLNNPIDSGLVQRLAPGDQPAVKRCLRGPQVRHSRAGDTIRPCGGAKSATFQSINIKSVNDQNVVQRRLD